MHTALPSIPPAEKQEKSRICRWLVSVMPRNTTIVVGAEVGVKQGRLADMLLRATTNLKLYLVDRWQESAPDEEYRKLCDPAALASQAEIDGWYGETINRMSQYPQRSVLLRGDSRKKCGQLQNAIGNQSLDFVFIDSDHSYQSRLHDLRAWSQMVRCDGFVAGGSLYSSFGGAGANRALEDWLREIGRDPRGYARGPAQTWMVKLG